MKSIKIWGSIALLTLCFGIVGCGGDDTASDAGAGADTTAAGTTTADDAE